MPNGGPSSAQSESARLGRTPHEWASGPTRASMLGRGCGLPCLRRGLGRCRVRHCVRRRGRSRPGRALGSTRAQARYIVRPSVSCTQPPSRGRASAPLPPPRRGWGGPLSSSATRLQPALPTGGPPTLAECAAPPYTLCLTARCRRARLSFPPMPPGEQHSTSVWPSARAYASRHSLPNRLS